MEKVALRRVAAESRARAFEAAPDAGHALVRTFPAFTPRVVAGYWPFRSEIDPRPLMAELAARGATLALPCTPPKGSGAGLAFRQIELGATLVARAFGVHEPPAHAPVVEPDLILVPLLAFDRTGARLGYGAGHYDRTLPALYARGARAIGLAFAAQEVARAPIDGHDVPLHGIATESGYIEAMRPPA